MYVAVLMGNMPPEPANYVQRAGRSGRGGVPTALALTMLRDNPFDYETMCNSKRPYQLPNYFARIRLFDSPDQVKRHIHSYLFNEAYKTLFTNGTNPVNSWDTVGIICGDSGTLAYIDQGQNKVVPPVFETGEEGNCYLDKICNRIENLQIPELLKVNFSDRKIMDIKEEFVVRLQEIKREFQALAQEMLGFPGHPGKIAQNEQNHHLTAAAMKNQFRQKYDEAFLARLAHERLTPSYGFPIDLIQFKYWVADNYTGSREASRGDEQAIFEYAPGTIHDIGDKLYRPDRIVANWESGANTPYKKIFYYTCKVCGHFKEVDTPQNTQCDVCQTEVIGWETGRNEEINAVNAHAAGAAPATQQQVTDAPVSIVNYIHSYIRPISFEATDQGSVTLEKKLSATGFDNTHYTYVATPGIFYRGGEHEIRVGKLSDATILNLNQGKKKYGFQLCPDCGHLERESGFDPQDVRRSHHYRQINGIRRQDNKQHAYPYRNIHLGARHKSDVFSWKVPINDNEGQRSKILTTLMTAARLVFASFLQVDPRTLGAEYISKVSQESNVALIHFYEHGSSGSSYMDDLNDNWEMLKKDVATIISERNIKKLLSYDTAYLMRTRRLDINATADWLEQHPEALGGIPYQVDNYDVQKIQWNELNNYLRINHEIDRVRIFLKNFSLQQQFAGDGTLLNIILGNGKISNVEIYVPNLPETPETYNRRCDLAYLAKENPALPQRHINVFAIRDFSSLGHISLEVNGKVFFAESGNDDINQAFATATWSMARNNIDVSEKIENENTGCTVFLPPPPPQFAHQISLLGKNPCGMYLDGENSLNNLRNKQVKIIIYLDRFMFSKYYYDNLVQLLKHFKINNAAFYLMTSRRKMENKDAKNMQVWEIRNALQEMKDALNLRSCNAKIGDLYYDNCYPKFPHDRLLLFQFEDNSTALISLPHGVAFTDPQRTQFTPIATMSITSRVDRDLCDVIAKYYHDLDTDEKVKKILIQ